jgi:hypothetical protein
MQEVRQSFKTHIYLRSTNMRRLFFALTLILVAAIAHADLVVVWDLNAETPDGYRVFQRDGAGSYNYATPFAEVDGTQDRTPPFSNPQPGETKCFVARAFVGDSESADSNEACYTEPTDEEPPPPDYALVLDDGDPGTHAEGTWVNSGGENPYGGSSIYSNSGGIYTYTFVPEYSGLYRLDIYWTAYRTRGDTTATFMGDQITMLQTVVETGGKWNEFSSYQLTAGQSYNLVITACSGPSSSVDAARIVLLEADTPTPPAPSINVALPCPTCQECPDCPDCPDCPACQDTKYHIELDVPSGGNTITVVP